MEIVLLIKRKVNGFIETGGGKINRFFNIIFLDINRKNGYNLKMRAYGWNDVVSITILKGRGM